MIRHRPAALALLCIVAFASAARGDAIVTKNGTRYEGRIVSEDATHVVIETPDLGTLRVARADVAEIEQKGKVRLAPKPDAVGTKPPPEAAKPGAAGSQPSGPAGGAAPAGAAPDPKDAALAAAEAEARRREEAELDAAARMARRKASTIRRRTAPGGAEPEPAEEREPNEDEIRRARERENLGGADLLRSAPGSDVIVFEPPRVFQPAPGATALGRRSVARFDRGGAATAVLTVTAAGKEERLALLLSDVQRVVPARTDAARIRLFEGLEEGDWLRVRMNDGSVVSGRFVEAGVSSVTLRVPSDEAEPAETTFEATLAVQVDGLRASSSVTRALTDTSSPEPVGVVFWPDGREIVCRWSDRSVHHVRLDRDGDGEADTVFSAEAPIAEIRRLPPALRNRLADFAPGAHVRVRGYEQYADARVERTCTAQVTALTAFAICVRTDDGSAVVPFPNLISLERATQQEADSSRRRVDPTHANLPVLPGAPAPTAQSEPLPKGISVVTNGLVVTHVYVAPPYDRAVFGVNVGEKADAAAGYSDLVFGTEVIPADGSGRPRELVSESVDGLRIVAYVEAKGTLQALEISAR